MEFSPLEKKAKYLYTEKNTNCAETLLEACNQTYHLGLDSSSIRLMGGFGGGLQTGSVCGALCGCTAALSALLIEDKAHECRPLHEAEVLLIRNFRSLLGDTLCSKIKPVHHSSETRCLDTVLLAAKAMDQTVYQLIERGILKPEILNAAA